MASGISEYLHTPVIYIGVHIYLFNSIYLFIYLCSRLKFIYDSWSYVVWCQANQQEQDRRAEMRSWWLFPWTNCILSNLVNQMPWEVNIP